jgi:Macrocin-O-methyltransferase (TylF)
MDLTVSPNTPIARLPRALRPPALLVRNLLPGLARRRKYVYEADGLATAHFSPFLEAPDYAALYATTASEFFGADIRWRMWILTSLAQQCKGLLGNFAEFGVYRGGCAFMVLSTCVLPPCKHLFLFDTFAGIPADRLTDSEITEGLAGGLADTARAQVASRLRPWREQITLVEGDVFETLPEYDTGPLAFVHMDMNAAAPTLRALDYVYPRLTEGAILVFDDYGWNGLEAQRTAVDEFFSQRSESVVALPTGQGLAIKR